MPLARVEAEGEDFLVNGTRLAPGETHTLRSVATLVRDGATYEVTSILVARNVGLVPALREPAGLCM